MIRTFNRSALRFFACLIPLVALLLTGCLPTDSAEVTALKSEVEALKQEVASLRGGDGSDNPIAKGRLDELTQRVSDIEGARGQIRDAVTTQINNQNTKLSRMFRDFNNLHEMILTGQTWAAIGLGYQGHVVARTQHGAFMVELSDQEKVEGGYRLQLRIGNPSGLHVQQFRIFGEFGDPPPDHSSSTDYNAYIAATERWEGSLKSFEATFLTPLEPNHWTDIGLTIPATKLSELQFIRFRMAVEQARLEKSEYDESFAVTGIDAPQVPLLKTLHGSFPLDVRDSRSVTGGYEIDFYIGNPFTMQISNSRMLIRYGRARPVYEESMDPKTYREALVEWTQSLRYFEQPVNDLVLPFHWNKVTVPFPTSNREELQFIECRWEILNISLRNPTR